MDEAATLFDVAKTVPETEPDTISAKTLSVGLLDFCNRRFSVAGDEVKAQTKDCANISSVPPVPFNAPKLPSKPAKW